MILSYNINNVMNEGLTQAIEHNRRSLFSFKELHSFRCAQSGQLVLFLDIV